MAANSNERDRNGQEEGDRGREREGQSGREEGERQIDGQIERGVKIDTERVREKGDIREKGEEHSKREGEETEKYRDIYSDIDIYIYRYISIHIDKVREIKKKNTRCRETMKGGLITSTVNLRSTHVHRPTICFHLARDKSRPAAATQSDYVVT